MSIIKLISLLGAQLGQDQNQVWLILYNHLEKLTDMQTLYNSATTLQKQQLVRMGFDSQLYYKSGSLSNPLYHACIFA
ncbi:MAG TPA: hypothetical protein VIJ75_14620 [Hanamia sp.]